MNKLTISFDVDGTLLKWSYYPTIQRWAVGDVPHMRMIKLMKKFHKLGHEVIIVTTRDARDDERIYKSYQLGTPELHYPFISVKQLIEDYNLPVASYHYTNGKLKASLLKQLCVAKHYDDNPWEVFKCHASDIPCKKVSDNDEPNDF